LGQGVEGGEEFVERNFVPVGLGVEVAILATGAAAGRDGHVGFEGGAGAGLLGKGGGVFVQGEGADAVVMQGHEGGRVVKANPGAPRLEAGFHGGSAPGGSAAVGGGDAVSEAEWDGGPEVEWGSWALSKGNAASSSRATTRAA
jgi:hypothetical protein